MGYCNLKNSIQKVRLIDERGEVLVMGGGRVLIWLGLVCHWLGGNFHDRWLTFVLLGGPLSKNR